MGGWRRSAALDSLIPVGLQMRSRLFYLSMPEPSPPFRILLVKTSSLGDVVHNLPVVTDLAREFPGAEIDWLVEEAFTAIPALHPAIRQVIPVAIRRWRKHLGEGATWAEIAAFRRQLRTTTYDAILDTQGLFKSGLLCRLAKGWRCGYASEAAREPLAAMFYNESFVIPRNLHAVDRNRWLAAAVFDYPPPDSDSVDYGIAAHLRSQPPSHLRPAMPYVVLLTATSRDDKLWAEEHWIALGRHFAEAGLTCLLPAGNAAEHERTARLAAAIPGALNLPPLGIAELAGLLADARLTVGVDTGLAHLATAVGTPTIALFCASEPGLTGVFGSGFYRNLGQRGQAPSVAEVITACADVALT